MRNIRNARPINKTDPDIHGTELLNQLSQCSTNATESLQPSDRLGFLENIKVIDCKREDIVNLPPEDDYITLSYVWGSPSELSAELKPLQRAPQTIRHAMKATLQLQKRSLWVDRYCILADVGMKLEHLRRMAITYENRLLTLVALGPNDQSGLPGISKPRFTWLSVQCTSWTLDFLAQGN